MFVVKRRSDLPIWNGAEEQKGPKNSSSNTACHMSQPLLSARLSYQECHHICSKTGMQIKCQYVSLGWIRIS